MPWQGWAAVSYVGLFEMGITFVLWLNALRLTRNTARISNLIFISPFISLLLLATIIGEEIHSSTLAAGTDCLWLARPAMEKQKKACHSVTGKAY